MERSLVVSDVDGTLLGDEGGTRRFGEFIALHRASLKLVYASGRFFDSLIKSIHEHQLPAPDAMICGVGSEIRDYPSGEIDGQWQQHVLQVFCADDVRKALRSFPGLVDQPQECQSPGKVSYFLHNAGATQLDALRDTLKFKGIHSDIVYSSGRDLDVMPQGVNKGSAAIHLAKRWEISHNNIVVCGDSGNDLPMFQLGVHGVIVANAQAELADYHRPGLFRATKPCADGVLEGLNYWLTEAVN